MRSKLRMLAVAAAGGTVLAISLSGMARAITDSVFEYSSEKTGWLMIPPAALVPDTGATVAWSNASDYAMQGTSSTIVCLNAPVNLPQGARLSALAIWFAKADTGYLAYSLNRRYVAQQTGNVIVSKSEASSGNQLTVANTDIEDIPQNVVNNRLYIYWFQLCVRQGGTFFGARITYKYTNAGD